MIPNQVALSFSRLNKCARLEMVRKRLFEQTLLMMLMMKVLQFFASCLAPGLEFWRKRFSWDAILKILDENKISKKEFAKLYSSSDVANLRKFVEEQGKLQDPDDVKNHNYDFHMYSVWEHVMASYTYAIISQIKTGIDIRNIALFHDIGKFTCFTEKEDGMLSFKGHQKESVDIMENQEIVNRYGFPVLSEEELFLIGYHEKSNLRKTTIQELHESCEGDKVKFKKLVLTGLIDWAAKGRTPKQHVQKEELAEYTKEMGKMADLNCDVVDFLISQ